MGTQRWKLWKSWISACIKKGKIEITKESEVFRNSESWFNQVWMGCKKKSKESSEK